ncbi:PREDICTED: protein NEN3 [Tarenaya hassleriana]|uniref:protein NEN3 n=1 Tax=Tarenaya hassleriana TaxID=28532 RepID=UPI00053CA606|nr:PREDICTED: protein NEN3 [Tarenaya hassleriana]
MASILIASEERSEIAFFDLETVVPTRTGEPFAIIEFGAILVCPKKLEELNSYSSLVRPSDLSLISPLSTRRSGITRDAVVAAPTFAEIADDVFDILNGRIWAGHNIVRFDCVRIREAFAEIGRSPPEPKATIDSLPLLSRKFGKRAGDMKMASLAAYFGLGDQAHRSLDDVRMNLEILKYCATVLFLESSVPDVLTAMSWFSPRTSPRRRSNEKPSPNGIKAAVDSSFSSAKLDLNSSSTDSEEGENNPMTSLLEHSSDVDSSKSAFSKSCDADPSDISTLFNKLCLETLRDDVSPEANTEPQHSNAEDKAFLGMDEVSIHSIKARLVLSYFRNQKIKLFHDDDALQLHCRGLKVRFGMSQKFVDNAGRPKLNFVVDAPPSLCKILDASDAAARNLSVDSGRSSEWRPVINKKNGFATARLHITTEGNGHDAQLGTLLYLEKPTKPAEKLVFGVTDFEKLESLLLPGTMVDAFFSVDSYDFQQMAGIRLAAKKLVIHSKE